MDRRHFIRTSALGVGALAAGEVPAQAKSNVQVSTERLPSEGYVTEPARKIPVVASSDVVICGGGPAGVAAALAAARQGVSVTLVEKTSFLGGLWTGGFVLIVWCIFGADRQGKQTQVIHGVTADILNRLDKMGMLIDPRQPAPDVEAAKYVLAEMLHEAGVQVLYNSTVAQVTTSGDRIDTILLETKSGRVAVRGKMFVDASGDGDLMEWTHEDFTEMKYNIGLNYRLGNVDRINQRAKGYKPHYIGGATPLPSVNWVNIIGQREQDSLDVFNTSRLQYELRKSAWENTENLKTQPGYDDVFLLDTAPILGTRVARVLNSRHNISMHESLHFTSYQDVVGISGGWTDLHVDGKKIPSWERPYWQIPLRALLPKRIQNLLVAGRCFGFEQALLEDAREIGTCFVTGQAAGASAAQAILQGAEPSQLDIDRLHAALKAQNVFLDI